MLLGHRHGEVREDIFLGPFSGFFFFLRDQTLGINPTRDDHFLDCCLLSPQMLLLDELDI